MEEFFIYSLASGKAKLPKLVLGLFSLIGGAFLFHYWLTLPPPAVERYYETGILYSDIYYERRSDSPKIIFKTENKDYKLYDYIWKTANVDPELIVKETRNSKNAKIWLSKKDGTDIYGIVTPSLSIEPSVGVEWERTNNVWMKWVAIMLIACGLILVFLTLLF